MYIEYVLQYVIDNTPSTPKKINNFNFRWVTGYLWSVKPTSRGCASFLAAAIAAFGLTTKFEGNWRQNLVLKKNIRNKLGYWRSKVLNPESTFSLWNNPVKANTFWRIGWLNTSHQFVVKMPPLAFSAAFFSSSAAFFLVSSAFATSSSWSCPLGWSKLWYTSLLGNWC